MSLALKLFSHFAGLLLLAIGMNMVLTSLGVPLWYKILAGFILGMVYPQPDLGKKDKEEDGGKQ